MLGWEYPPFFNGGLGVASTGIAEALSPHVELTLIVPRTGNVFKAPSYELIGLHQRMLPARQVETQKVYETLQERVKLAYVEVDLSGYDRLPPAVRQVPVGTEYFKVRKVVSEVTTEPSVPFLIKELYGDDLSERIHEYSELVVEMAGEMSFDVIHAHDWMTFLAGMELKARFNKPLVLHIHSLSYDRNGPLERGFVYELERHAMLQADRIIPVSTYTAETIQTYYGISPRKLVPVHNGVHPQTAYRIPKPFKEKLVVFLGRLTEQKGPMYFFKAAQILLKQTENVRFIIAGKGELIDELIRETAKAEIGDRLHFTGFLEPDRAQDMLAMADVYVMPSVSEPFGIAALEAAQMEVPCIISKFSGVAEVLSHAISVDYANHEMLARIIYGLLEDDYWRTQVVSGQLEDLKGISWDQTAQKILGVYEEVLP